MSDQGKNEVAKSLLDLQPTAILELFKLYPDYQNRPEIFFTFHGGSNFANNVTWQGLQYLPLPVETEGFGVFADGTLPRPKIRVGNANKIVTVFLEKYSDFKNAAIFRKKVFLKHLDDVNFDAGNPFGVANPDAEISEEKYFFGQKTIENHNYVEFELNSPLDLDNFGLNERTISAKYCYWQYRGLGCQYAGKPVEKADGLPFTNVDNEIVAVSVNDEFASQNPLYGSSESYNAGDSVYLENQKVIVGRNSDNERIFHKTYYVCVSGNDPSNPQHPEGNDSFWQKDGCAKKISACQKRYAPNSSVLKRVFLGEGDEKTIKYIHNKTNNPLAFLTESDAVTGSDSPFGYEGGTGQFTILYTFRKTDFSAIETEGEPPIKTVDETIFATAKLDRDSSNFTTGPDNLSGFNMSYTRGQFGGEITDRRNRLRFYNEKEAELKFQDTNNNFFTNSFNTHIINVNSYEKKRLTSFLNPALNVEGALFSLNENVNYNDTTNQSTGMANFLGLFGDSQSITADQAVDKQVSSFQGDIVQFCAWNRKLNNTERTLLATTNMISDQQYTVTDNGNQIKSSNFNKGMGMPISYDECTGELRDLTGDGLIVWYDMETGFLDSPINTVTGILDQHTGNIHLSGYGGSGFEQRELTYTPASMSAIVPNQTEAFTLPFGGFPGTDGYDYESRGTS